MENPKMSLRTGEKKVMITYRFGQENKHDDVWIIHIFHIENQQPFYPCIKFGTKLSNMENLDVLIYSALI